MNTFTVLEKRGSVLSATSLGRASARGGDYDEARGPRGSRPGAPREMARSRRVGLSRTVCVGCGGVKDQGFVQHDPLCVVDLVPGLDERFVRQTTGPLAINETAADVGWN